jgi:ribosome-binding factor A
MTRRTDRIGHVIQRELTEFIRREISDPRIGFFTLSRVDVTPDLSFAKAMVSVLGTDIEKRNTLDALSQHANRMRSHLAKALQTRTVPRVLFAEDKNLEHGFRVAELLGKIREEERAKQGGEKKGEEKSEEEESD